MVLKMPDKLPNLLGFQKEVEHLHIHTQKFLLIYQLQVAQFYQQLHINHNIFL
jgi:hypothetical protein